MLGEKIRQHGARVFLVNTGWTGGPHGTGSRMKLAHTRRMINAALNGELDRAETTTDPFFGLAVPKHVEGVPDEVLNPRATWADPEEYDRKARELAAMFSKNFERYADSVPDAVAEAGPTAAQTA
jgi:phosphoenolpyruvate carboxykinase (ATP)